ncbi:MAG TPA: hypothetical protein VHW66_10045 [Stellaceae bacterium]|jgi:hypothetical protein|nr:hypothetical protein [Stellaceae bacterium]
MLHFDTINVDLASDRATCLEYYLCGDNAVRRFRAERPERRTCNENVTKIAGRAQTMDIMEFQVCQQGQDAHWVVRLDDAEYGDYLDKEAALLDAVDAAHDARQTGREAEVWLHEQTNAARIL